VGNDSPCGGGGGPLNRGERGVKEGNGPGTTATTCCEEWGSGAASSSGPKPLGAGGGGRG
jgi:hypothetical protein